MSFRERRNWEAALAPLLDDAHGALWRAHCDALHEGLLSRWLERERFARALKTDLYDEALGDGLVAPLSQRAESVVGVDLAANVVRAAQIRHRGLCSVQADVRRLPFAAGSFDLVVSNSTLDHFSRRAEIETALREIHRVTTHDGRLLLTLDNLANPAVALRNALPLRWLRRVGLVPYPVGATLGPRGLQRLLRRVGFEVCDTDAVLHCPRAIVVARARRLQRRNPTSTHAAFLHRLRRWERLATWPTRFVTGYFIAVHARKR